MPVTSETREKKRQNALRQWSDPAARKRNAERARALWADPGFRERATTRMREIGSDPATASERSARAVANWERPEYRARQTARAGRHRFRPSALERHVHAELRQAGVEFVVHPDVAIPGRSLRPDIGLPGRGVLIEVNGCFWHGCTTCYEHPRMVSAHHRDAERIAVLTAAGYVVRILWEHDLTPEAIRRAAA